MGLGVLKAKAIRSYLRLEDMFATTWLKDNCGKEAYKKVWLPLLKGKFGDCYEEISAVWIWNKFKLRGGSRNNGGHEVLVYFENGFKEIISKICSKLEALGVKFLFDSPVDKVEKEGDEFLVYSNGSVYNFKKLSFTTSPKDFVDVVKFLPTDYKNSLMRIRHLANICLVLVLDKKFSDIYWLNVADENFPFVGIIEHTNFHSSEHYGGKHILYLSKYLKEYDVLYSYSKEELVDYSLKFLQKINPDFKKDSIEEAYLFKSKCSQPIIEKEYSKLLFSMKTKVDNLFFTSMAQIYPQDRGTNFAVKYGRMLAKEMLG
ncbi:MAG: FAD-dependent oxidoreductase [Bdellovibrionota bacterium]